MESVLRFITMLSDYIMIINKDNIRYESIISNHFETHCDEFANIFANILFVGWHYKIDDIYIDIFLCVRIFTVINKHRCFIII